ncbi:MAG: hypothetical protein KAS87_01080 [Candidatus Omnitrophica bacterium]|nr:hypothetical protein [Candidatus Omnitrophota bacterium]
MKSERLKRIIEKNIKLEKKSPYNFCDRWCNRCSYEKQIYCKLYQNEFEQKITCIAHGKEPGDPEITKEVIRKQFEDTEKKIEQFTEDNGMEFGGIEIPEFKKVKQNFDLGENKFLYTTARRYCKRAEEFLKDTFFNEKGIKSELAYDLEAIAWYDILLARKLHGVLSGFCESNYKDEFLLCDTVAQFAICKKAINESLKALRRLKPHYLRHKNLIIELLAMLHNISSRMKAVEESI